MSNHDYIKRRIGILDENSVADYGSITMQDIRGTINSRTFIQKLKKKVWFNNIGGLSLIIYFLNALVQIEFKKEVYPAYYYFIVLDAICLSFIIFHFSITIFSKDLTHISHPRLFELLGIIIACLLLVFDTSQSVPASALLYKICSIIRFLPLLSKIELTYKKENKRRFSIVPFRTNLERLLNLLNSLRCIEWIHNDSDIDRELAWSIRCICTQTLYNVEVQTENKEQEEIIKWAMSERPQFDTRSPINKELTVELTDAELSLGGKQCLEKVNNLGFDVFQLKEASNNNELIVLSTHLFSVYEVFKAEQISRKKFNGFIKAVQSGYLSELPYHNSTHAADVVQAFHYYLIGCEIKDSYNYSLTDYAICILSACIHDYQHPGRTNVFLMNTKNKLAVIYNDISVLENHHVASCFKLMYEKDSNFLENMPNDKFRKYRSLMIELVLATDFSKHFKELAKFKLRFSKENEAEKSKNSMLKMLMHAADVSNSTRKWPTYFEWAERVLKEFFAQGDEERELGLTISPLCDRNTVSFAKSQIGFIDLFIMPIFGFLSEIDQKFQKCKKNVEKNRHRLLSLSASEDPDEGKLIS